MSSEECQNRRNYFVATQDKDLRLAIGRIPGVPLIYLNKVSLVLEPPSVVSRNFGEKVFLLLTSHVMLVTAQQLGGN